MTKNKQARAIIDYVEARLREALGHGDSLGDLRELSEKRREMLYELDAAFEPETTGGESE
jgi:hypothetical protein